MKIKAKKSYGQHFLIRVDIAEQIASALKQVQPNDIVLEVGPGTGFLTEHLLQLYGDRLYAVEADKDMVSVLQKKFPTLGQRLIQEDFLRFRFDTLAPECNIHLIGNYPYNISSQIIFRMLEQKHRIVQMVGMFQKEVGDRIISPSGNKDYGITSVLTQPYYACEQVVVVPPEAFDPPPKVMSIVIRLIRKADYVKTYDERLFKTLVKTTFNQRRKMLRNTLKSLFPDEWLKETLFQKRPEQLSWEEFVLLAERFTEYRKQNPEELTE
jgi:16S rRNA (adenine1518-N6/adenine1519-N6)-dimethyltransferase